MGSAGGVGVGGRIKTEEADGDDADLAAADKEMGAVLGLGGRPPKPESYEAGKRLWIKR